ncbi:serine hydrolase domain-containing protein [Peterkaempfera bronchialis]|uniref:Class A beta-lactamase-related serine hydrolase n=1 Tax=Peterkaempfera bronchialis TaxID=2126346 RepID=A0A345SSD3_9ACTN|nr:serine hydrolase domain-containing protein [Peterkaempfera bronchialis]AXI76638.1 class A beta-lactamase-related serine hydrolase [Peterkaempfera bronchialis]
MPAELADHCADVLTAYGCPSVSVAVAQRGVVTLAEAHGLADPATGRPATTDTAYLLASVTKPITATAVCLAADQGLLALDAPLPGRDSGPTIRQVLLHRGGFGQHYDFSYDTTDAEVALDDYAALYREPGSGFEYSNLGYGLLGRALAAATGQEFGDVVRERVFAPLGLTAAHLGPRHQGLQAVPHTADGRAYPAYGTSHPGASLGWATASEAALFGLSYSRLLRPETATAMLDGIPIDGRLGYGLGWFVSSGDGPRTVSHSGSMGGVATMLVVLPDQETALCVLTNSTDRRARDAVVGRLLDGLVADRDSVVLPPPVSAERPMAVPEGRWTGGISTPDREVPLTLRVRPDRQVELRLDGGAAVMAQATASADWDLRVSFPVQLPSVDARRNSPASGLELALRDGHLTGAARAFKDGEGDGWLGNLLSHPCALEAD